MKEALSSANGQRVDACLLGLDDTTRLYTLPELSERLRIPVATLVWLRRSRKGPKAVPLGKRLYFRECDVREWLESQVEAS